MLGTLRAPSGVVSRDVVRARSAVQPAAVNVPTQKTFLGAPVQIRPQRSVSSASTTMPVIRAVAAPLGEEAPAEGKAVLRYVRGSPNKMRRVLDQIRGSSYEEALMVLEFMPYRACEPILKLLVSAASNAKNNLGMKKTRLYVSECFADKGPVLKRYKPRAKGRADMIKKPTSHITIKVKER